MQFRKSAALFCGALILFTMTAAIYYPRALGCGGIILEEEPTPAVVPTITP